MAGYESGDWIDLDKALFWGASYNDEMLLDRFSQSAPKPRYPFPEVIAQQHIKFDPPRQRFPLNDIQMELPQWNRPNYWSHPLDLSFTTTIDFYKTPTNIGVYNIPKNKMVIIQGISYEFDSQLGLFDEFDVEIFESNILVTRFRDMRVQLAAAEPNPAHQFAFSGHLFPIPIEYSVDQSHTITIRVSIIGTSPFPKTTADPYNGSCTVKLLAYESQLADRRDGAPRLKAQNKTLDEIQAVRDAGKAYTELKELFPDYDPAKVDPNGY